MKLLPLSNNINFGYNKALSTKLEKRLEKEPNTPINRTILSVNRHCNGIEDEIIRLEANNSTDKNESTIDILLDYLFEAKMFLCEAVERCFPDLNFLKASCDSYDIESTSNIDECEYSNEIERSTRPAFVWRDIMVDNLLNLIERTTDTYTSEPEEKIEKLKTMMGHEYDEQTAPQNLIEKYVPNIDSPKSLEDVAGLSNVIQDIKDFILFPLENPQKAIERKEEYGIKIPGFTILYGPPGCGKTMLAQAIAAQSGCDMYCLDLSKVGSSYINATSTNINAAFEYVEEQAKNSEKPVILFMDEMDSLAEKRMQDGSSSKEDNKVVNTLLPLITGAKAKNVLIIGATNMYNFIDPAIVRRSEMKQYIGLPDEKDIAVLLKKGLTSFKKGCELASREESIEQLSKELLGYSPSNIKDIIMAASIIAYRNKREIQEDDFYTAIKNGSYEKINEKEYKLESKAKKIGFEK